MRFGHLWGKAARYTSNTFSSITYVTQLDGSRTQDRLTGIERLVFADDATAFDLNGAAGETYRLYQAAFNRKPDAGGLGFWIAQRDNGLSMNDMAQKFMAANEFVALYGSAPAPTAFVTALYTNVMHCAPDQAGLDYWVNAMTNGTTREFVLATFSESPENQLNVIGQIQNGIHYLPFGI